MGMSLKRLEKILRVKDVVCFYGEIHHLLEERGRVESRKEMSREGGESIGY